MRKAFDLFSGCGGLTCGLKTAGFSVIGCSEIRPEAREAYALNHPDTLIYEDIRLLTAETILNDSDLEVGDLDLLAACPPCQGFSSIRTKNREIADDPRNELIFDVLRLVEGLLPKCILIENVPNLLKDSRLVAFKAKLAGIYEFSEGILNAEDFGVPQRRKRMILIGCRLGKISLPKKLRKRRVVRDVLWGLPSPEGVHRRPLHRIRQHFSPIVQQRIEAIKSSRTELPENLILDCHRKYPEGFKDVYGRLSWDKVSSTITRSSHNPSKGRFLHPTENRALTIYESLLLQGFPRKYRLPKLLGVGKLASLIGEAFPPPMAEAQAKHVRKKLEAFEMKSQS